MSVHDVRSFDRLGRFYDLAMPPADAEMLARGLADARRPVERVLDVGGGPGRAVRELTAPTRVVLDPARGMLRQAHSHGLGTIQADGATMPVRDRSVDAVLVTDALHHVHDQRGLLEEAARVLRPGGVLLVREFDPTTLRGRALVAAEHLVGFESAFHSPERLAAMVSEAGLAPAVRERGFAYTVTGRAENGDS